jgi:serine phosphatase RsbU (regulator of sigma subunit)
MKTLRRKILGIILIYSIFSILVLLVSSYYFETKEKITQVGATLNKVYFDVFSDLNKQKEFFVKESINPDYFRTEESPYLRSHITQIQGLDSSFLSLTSRLDELGYDPNPHLGECRKLMLKSSGIFLTSVEYLNKRGFREFGMIGKLERILVELRDSKYVDPLKISEIRIIEKDYLISDLEVDKELLIRRMMSLQEDIQLKIMPVEKKAHLDLLTRSFNWNLDAFAKINKQLGLVDRSGMIADLDETSSQFLNALSNFQSDLSIWESVKKGSLRAWFMVLLILYVALSLVFGYWVSKNTTRSLEKLGAYINGFVKNNFARTSELKTDDMDDEVAMLSQNFKILEDELDDYLHNFQLKVDQRTRDLHLKNLELKRSHELIRSQNDDIIDSIKYAQRIQQAILPSQSELQRKLKDYFLMYLPKDIVSGDFFWSFERNEKDNKKLYFALGDCTGHGVPGAFMSILGSNTLNSIMQKGLARFPHEIMVELNARLTDSLNRKGLNGVADGMDLAICMIDEEKEMLYFSGALISLIYSKGNKFFELPPDRAYIGGEFANNGYMYKQHAIPLSEVDNLHLFSDGIVDQFGGPQGKKLMKKNLMKILEGLSPEAMNIQKVVLTSAFEKWKKSESQIDDVSVFGLNTNQFKRSIEY